MLRIIKTSKVTSSERIGCRSPCLNKHHSTSNKARFLYSKPTLTLQPLRLNTLTNPHEKFSVFNFKREIRNRFHQSSLNSFSEKKDKGNRSSNQEKVSFFEQAKRAWRETPIKWAPIPIGLGLSYIALRHLWDITDTNEQDDSSPGIKKKKGPWQIQVYTSLPLKSLSRFFGYFNELTLPVWFREPGLKFYSWVFGCNLEEMDDPDLKNYPNLAAFFFRKLKPGARPIADALLVSPADGRVLHFGVVEGSQIEQIKGITYDLNDLFGRKSNSPSVSQSVSPSNYNHQVVDETSFANLNGIDYSLQGMLHGEAISSPHPIDESLTPFSPPADAKNWEKLSPGQKLFFCVIYLAPGDYHRFHSPTNWVVSFRRHFAGELYSVSPFVIKYLENLFVLNERVVLEGRWRHGFFSMLPIGATNVGSIKIHFDEDLKTNEKKVTHRGTYTQVSYDKASSLLKGYPLAVGQEIGGFCLGSTVVLVFSAPENFQFDVQANQKVQVGQKLGDVPRLSKSESTSIF